MSQVNQDTFTGASFSLRNRVARFIWDCVYVILFRYSPRPLHKWRSFLLRLFGAKIGKGSHIYPKVKIWAPWNLELGETVGIGDYTVMYSQGRIKVGDRTTISQYSHICTGTHDYRSRGFELITRPIFIGSDCWLAASTFVHPGVNIGDGAIVGACSVVTRDLDSWKIYAGNPCIYIKNRYEKNTDR